MTNPLFTIDDVIPEHILEYARVYEREIWHDIDKRVCAKWTGREYPTGTGVSLRTVDGGLQQ